ncbi:4-hydroxy-tetrahydrodipicolinate synthase [Alkalicoccobacillus porphyridii]|uniref:4-hydroxy-tetrahydrodipicolinate synthase n=1 Tax=Alkalicoccobacillus porphyridii TaxID=2597270 RepID=A0A554A411_9BACI|nr:4-hydroxy-tetrahydrodipicolinate synthase [Alkalicoccobacillus porphyridii]TSB48396.1 4-hydroxy-tetrahydrodipicolinate synthase [Alkalicoccobacillus porphyridii]
MELKGIYPALLTPMDEKENINEAVLKQLTNHLIKSGVHGLFALGTNGEFHALTTEEKVRVAEILVKEAAGRVPVMVGTGGNNTAEAILLSQKMEQIGADVLSVITPYFIPPTQDELYYYFKEIADSVSIPVLLYNIPSKTGVNLEASTVKRLASHPKIIGVKDSSGNFDTILSYIEVAKGEDFSVFAGTDSLILKTLKAGGQGAVAATANALPKVVVSIYDSWKNGELDKAEEAQQTLQPLRDTFALGSIPAPLKKATELFGIPVGPPRSPIKPVNEEAVTNIKKMVQSYESIN